MAQSGGTGVHTRGHVVVASADSEAFRSLRRRSTSRLDRYRMGKQLRRQVPRSSLGDWSVQADRPDPVQLIIESHRGRLDWLIPLRVGRMTATPYGFLRGAATVMAEDVARLPSTGIAPVICGDSHLGNFGFHASPEQGGAGVQPDEASPRRGRAAPLPVCERCTAGPGRGSGNPGSPPLRSTRVSRKVLLVFYFQCRLRPDTGKTAAGSRGVPERNGTSHGPRDPGPTRGEATP
jgi:hypothetical protein